MDWKLEPNNEDDKGKNGDNWKFIYLGGTSEMQQQEGNGLPKELSSSSSYPLSQASVGSTVWIVGFRDKGGINRLLAMGLKPRSQIKVVTSQTTGSVMISVGDTRIALGAEIATKIMVSNELLTNQKEIEDMAANIKTSLKEMNEGSIGKIVGYDKTRRGYKGKLLSMGLTPGTEFTIIRIAPFGDPIEINVRGFNLSLRKQEADALVVEEIGEDDEK